MVASNPTCLFSLISEVASRESSLHGSLGVCDCSISKFLERSMGSAISKSTASFFQKGLMLRPPRFVWSGCNLVGKLSREPQRSRWAVIENQAPKADPCSQFMEVHAVAAEVLSPQLVELLQRNPTVEVSVEFLAAMRTKCNQESTS